MTVTTSGWEAFAAYAYPPNELGYCGPPDPSVLLAGRGADVAEHAQGFDGAWPYLEEIAAAAGTARPARRRRGARLLGGRATAGPGGRRGAAGPVARTRCRASRAGCSPTSTAGRAVLANHSFHVFVVYPWVRFLDADPTTPLRILQSCRIRWGTVDSVDDEHVVIASRPLVFDGGQLCLGEPVEETVRWRPPTGHAGAAAGAGCNGRRALGLGLRHPRRERRRRAGRRPPRRRSSWSTGCARGDQQVLPLHRRRPGQRAVAELGQRRVERGDPFGFVGDAAVGRDRRAVVGLEVVPERLRRRRTGPRSGVACVPPRR